MATRKMALTRTSLDQYFKDINRFPLLTRAAEFELARRLKDEGDVDAARDLTTANLRFVAKVAFEYRKYQINMIDLIQEGNIGLMVAVQKFDPHRGYRLISYAVWWIKAYIQNFILRSWSLVKLGTTGQQRKMLFGSKSAATKLEDELEEVTVLPALATCATNELMQLDTRIARRDFSLDSSLDDTARVAYVDMLRCGDDLQEEDVSREEARQVVRQRLGEVRGSLTDRERYILDHRMLTDEPVTLQEIGARYGITRERTRQIETGLKKKLAAVMPEFSEGCAEVVTLG